MMQKVLSLEYLPTTYVWWLVLSIMGSLKAIQVQQKPLYIKRKVYKHICEYHIRDLEVQPYT